ncbi:hypothetical protein FACS1894145_6350 [Bacteroidia bacterium]|nr:hypothetical protein FACS1894145_6350 [Bacteroidia bacterium]
MSTNRKLPIGIQDFEKLRTGNNVYVDKTFKEWAEYVQTEVSIDERKYAAQYAAGNKKVVKVGAEFSAEERTLNRWVQG